MRAENQDQCPTKTPKPPKAQCLPAIGPPELRPSAPAWASPPGPSPTPRSPQALPLLLLLVIILRLAFVAARGFFLGISVGL